MNQSRQPGEAIPNEELDPDDQELIRQLDEFVSSQELAERKAKPTFHPAAPFRPESPPSAAAPKIPAPANPVPRTAAAHATPYTFPRSTSSLAGANCLADQLRDLVEPKGARGAAKGPYALIRERYCALNIALNEEGLRPPAFRVMRKRRPGEVGQDADTLTLDNLVIDLHWLHSRGIKPSMDDLQYPDLLDTETFDFDAVERYVTEKWTKKVRLLRFDLTDIEQWQLSTLRERQWAERIVELFQQRHRLQSRFRRLRQAGEKLPEDRAEDFADLWLASELAKNESLDLVAAVHGWIRGAPPLARTTVIQKTRNMRRWVDKTAR